MNERRAGALALLGSGEYLPVMNDTDMRLLETVGGPGQAQVALIPAASGLEDGAPERWNRLGEAHFRALGAAVIPLWVFRRDESARSFRAWEQVLV
jgi:hypothetical protein